MKILHSSDWHIGRHLFGKKRYDEFQCFLSWVVDAILVNQVDALLIAGDIFDTTTPSNKAQELYYDFLCRVAQSPCRHIVIIAGNHDSPTFLNAPKQVLRFLNIHVVGQSSESGCDEVIVLNDQVGSPELIVCAVPYLRDKDVRTVDEYDSTLDKSAKLISGIKDHYKKVTLTAREKLSEIGKNVPMVAMGHLFAAGGKTLDGDGVRELYVGSLAQVTSDIFSSDFAYVALGHLHVPQKVNNNNCIRYCGSPIPMGFGEAKQQKMALIVEINQNQTQVTELNIPTFQKLESIKGSWEDICCRLNQLKTKETSYWLEIELDDPNVITQVAEKIDDVVSGTRLEVLKLKIRRSTKSVVQQAHLEESLNDLDTMDVFMRCLTQRKVPEEQKLDLTLAYKETLTLLLEEDGNAI